MDSMGKLTELLGFDPTKQNPNQSVLQSALEDITKERDAKLKERVKEQLVKAIEIAQKWNKLKAEFHREEKKNDKELGKIINGLNAIQKGQAPPPEESEEAESEVDSSEA